MNFRTKSSNVTKVLYIILILCILGIMGLSLYSLFNQNNQNNLNDLNNNSLNLNNIGEAAQNGGGINDVDSEEAIRNFYRQQTTEAIAKPETTDKPKPVPFVPEITEEIATPPEIGQEDEEQLIPVIPAETSSAPNMPNTPNATEKKADSAIDQTEEAVEVISSLPPVYIKPLNGYISKKYNPDNPEYSVAMNDYRTHVGIDIDSDIGTNVKSVYNGVVSEITDDPLMGKTVVVTHDNGIQSVYMNLQEQLPKNITVGVSVKSGDVIGGVGETALIETSDVPHLHLEMKKDGKYVDPLDYIKF